jgi:hypothetical protein
MKQYSLLLLFAFSLTGCSSCFYDCELVSREFVGKIVEVEYASAAFNKLDYTTIKTDQAVFIVMGFPNGLVNGSNVYTELCSNGKKYLCFAGKKYCYPLVNSE